MVRLQEPMRSIGEVADSLDLPQHVLRFWETRFKEIDPLKRAGGRRLYRQRDVDIVVAIRHLLYKEGYTIKGVQRILKEQGVDSVVTAVLERINGAPAPDAEASPGGEQGFPESDGDVDEFEAEMEHVGDAGSVQLDAMPFPEPHPMQPQTEPEARLLDETDARPLLDALAEIEECKRLLKLTIR